MTDERLRELRAEFDSDECPNDYGDVGDDLGELLCEVENQRARLRAAPLHDLARVAYEAVVDGAAAPWEAVPWALQEPYHKAALAVRAALVAAIGGAEP
jgi:hypothetical protein